MPACKDKSYQASDYSKYADGSSGNDGGSVGTARSGSKGGHEGSGEGESAYAGRETRGARPEILPVAPDVSKNVEQALRARLPRGPDCRGRDGKAAACGDPAGEKVSRIFQPLSWIVGAVFAANDPAAALRLIPDRTFTQAQLLALVQPGGALGESLGKVANVHVFGDGQGSVFNRFEAVLTLTDGREVWLDGSNDIAEGCRLLETAFPLDTGKEFFNVTETGSGARSRLRHPYQGRACKAQNLEGYRILSFASKATSKDPQPLPGIVFLIAKNPQKDPSYLVNSRYRGETELSRQIETALRAPAKDSR